MRFTINFYACLNEELTQALRDRNKKKKSGYDFFLDWLMGMRTTTMTMMIIPIFLTFFTEQNDDENLVWWWYLYIVVTLFNSKQTSILVQVYNSIQSNDADP
jgi:hypothetical protein